jgi:hypothetical protein
MKTNIILFALCFASLISSGQNQTIIKTNIMSLYSIQLEQQINKAQSICLSFKKLNDPALLNRDLTRFSGEFRIYGEKISVEKPNYFVGTYLAIQNRKVVDIDYDQYAPNDPVIVRSGTDAIFGVVSGCQKVFKSGISLECFMGVGRISFLNGTVIENDERNGHLDVRGGLAIGYDISRLFR